jgi:hypothetical protein
LVRSAAELITLKFVSGFAGAMRRSRGNCGTRPDGNRRVLNVRMAGDHNVSGLDEHG